MDEVYVSVKGTELSDIFETNIVSVQELFDRLIDQQVEIHYLIEKIEDSNREDIDPATEYGVSDRDFI